MIYNYLVLVILQDGVWEAPTVSNPVCDKIGCGEWKRPMIQNPHFKGIWNAPKVSNPLYIGEIFDDIQG